jgi:hypothetical protein
MNARSALRIIPLPSLFLWLNRGSKEVTKVEGGKRRKTEERRAKERRRIIPRWVREREGAVLHRTYISAHAGNFSQ